MVCVFVWGGVIGAYVSRERDKSVPWQGSMVADKQDSRIRKLRAHNFNASTKQSEQEVA